MINYDSIISAYNDKPTLMEWLKKVEEALKGASATSFSVNKKGNATISFQIDFEDGTSLESGDIVLQQGESVASAAIVNGHLILTLTNGDELDAGSVGAVSSFSIDASQHLIVNYQDGTTNDLGAIFNGNISISGNLAVSGSLSVPTMTGNTESSGNFKAVTLEQTAFNYSQNLGQVTNVGGTLEDIYSRFAVINGVLHVIVNLKITGANNSIAATSLVCFAANTLPSWLASKLVDLNGDTADGSGSAIITREPCVIMKGNAGGSTGYNAYIEVTNRSAAGQIGVYLYTKEAISKNNDDVLYVCARIALTLL